MTGVKTKQKYAIGTTLIELLVSISIFSILITVSSQLFAKALGDHQRALERAELLNQASYALEYMNRSLRMAQKDVSGGCIAKNLNYDNPAGNVSAIRFLNYQGKCVEFSSQDVSQGGKVFKVVMVRKSPNGGSAGLGSYISLTPAGLSADNLHFLLNGQSQGDSLQPGVSIAMEIKGRTSPAEEIKIQSTVSQRELDAQY
ncbi:MAG: hypothetical protein PHU56_00720 [Candidatus Pacebacteria bacterium]|nr:hypothetical protein [Candidatus Paceibacterota bacterium]